MFATPARSDRYAMCAPSGDHDGLDGWRMSISCSIVRCELVGGCAGTISSEATAIKMRFMSGQSIPSQSKFPDLVRQIESADRNSMEVRFGTLVHLPES